MYIAKLVQYFYKSIFLYKKYMYFCNGYGVVLD